MEEDRWTEETEFRVEIWGLREETGGEEAEKTGLVGENWNSLASSPSQSAKCVLGLNIGGCGLGAAVRSWRG